MCSPSTRSPELLGTGKDTKCTAHLGQCPYRTPKNLSGLVLETAWDTGPTWGSALAEQPGNLSSVNLGSTCCLGLWQTQCGPPTVSTPHTCQQYLFAVLLPPHNTTEQMNLNKWPPSPPCVRAEIRHWRDLQTEEAKIKKGELLWKWQMHQSKTLNLILETVHFRGTYRPWEQVQARTSDYLTLNWSHNSCPTTAPEKFSDIFLLLSLIN